MLNVKIRIGNLAFRKATYLGKQPEYPAYHIDVIERNDEYFDFKKGYFKERTESSYIYVGPDEKKRDSLVSYDASCFESPETSWAIATYQPNKGTDSYELIIPDYHIDYFIDPKHEEIRKNFWKLLKAINASGVFDEENIEPDIVEKSE